MESEAGWSWGLTWSLCLAQQAPRDHGHVHQCDLDVLGGGNSGSQCLPVSERPRGRRPVSQGEPAQGWALPWFRGTPVPYCYRGSGVERRGTVACHGSWLRGLTNPSAGLPGGPRAWGQAWLRGSLDCSCLFLEYSKARGPVCRSVRGWLPCSSYGGSSLPRAL